MMRAGALALLAALPVAAFAGEPSVIVDQDEARGATRVNATIDIAAPPAAVWGVISDCARAAKIVPNVESCRVVSREAGGAELREVVVNVALLPRQKVVSRHTFEPPRRLAFKRASGDMKISEGEWRIEPLAAGKASRLTYRALFAPDFFAPQFLIESAARRDTPIMLQAVEKAALDDAGKN